MTESMFSLAGKVAVITGASKNIGAAISRGYAQQGADLLLVARGREALEAHARTLREETGRQIETYAADVGQADSADAIAEYASSVLPPVTTLVNNAFAAEVQNRMLDMHDSEWDDVIAVNIMGPFRLARALGRVMADQPGSSIINVVSGSGFLPVPTMGAYGVTKSALWMMTRYLAVELAPQIRVNALCPGITTEDGQPFHPIHDTIIPSVPMRRLGRADEMVGAAVYLASDAASYSTGGIIFCNGGRPW